MAGRTRATSQTPTKPSALPHVRPSDQIPPVFHNELEMIANTPMLDLRRTDAVPCKLFAKLEGKNPGNPTNDRSAISMIEAAEHDGRLKPGGHIIEAPAG